MTAGWVWMPRATSWAGAAITLSLLQLGVHVPHFRQVAGPRSGIQVRQETVASGLGLELGYAAPRIVDVPEDDRLGGAGLLAGGQDLPVPNLATRLLGLDLRRVDALDAVGALLHDA